MEVKDAVKVAKQHVAELFADERIDEIGLEETEYDERKTEWQITVGFRRTFVSDAIIKTGTGAGRRLAAPAVRSERSYKVVRIREGDGKVLGVIDRILRDAA